MRIALFDPSYKNYCSSNPNLGDEIISKSILHEIKNRFKNSVIYKIPTQIKPNLNEIICASKANLKIVGGTNILCSEINKYNQWKTSFFQNIILKDIILMGVGWWQYQSIPNNSSKKFYKRILSKTIFHSIRDSYSNHMFDSIGGLKSVNTSCPTLWSCNISTANGSFKLLDKGSLEIITTLTDYKKDPYCDFKNFEIIKKYSKNVWFWPQGKKDLDYFNNLNLKANILNLSVDELSNFFTSKKNLVYCGTRLHCGIYSLKYGIPSIIINVDNRAQEISNDTGLLIANRGDFLLIDNWLSSPQYFFPHVPQNTIQRWFNQFL